MLFGLRRCRQNSAFERFQSFTVEYACVQDQLCTAALIVLCIMGYCVFAIRLHYKPDHSKLGTVTKISTVNVTCENVCLVKIPFKVYHGNMTSFQRKRHRLALKKRRTAKRKEQAAEYAKLLAQRQKEAKVRRQEEIKRRRSASLRDSKSSSQSAPQK